MITRVLYLLSVAAIGMAFWLAVALFIQWVHDQTSPPALIKPTRLPPPIVIDLDQERKPQ